MNTQLPKASERSFFSKGGRVAALALCVLVPTLAGATGFSEADVLFYGEVRQIGGAHAVLRQAGRLEMTFVKRSDPANRVTVTTEMTPTGFGQLKPFSYALRVPLMYLPEAAEKDSALSIGTQDSDFLIEDIRVDGTSATLPDGSKEFFALSFASRGAQYRLDLLVEGDGTDSDGDGLSDWWETLHGLDPNTPDASADPDGDGWTNLEEFLRGSDPNQSNRAPLLVTQALAVPESGEAGILLQFLDSDTSAGDLSVTLDASSVVGFELNVDGAPASGTLALTLADLQSGRFCIRHVDTNHRSAQLPVIWNDGTTGGVANVTLQVATPSTEDGTDASLWLDGDTLGAAGGPLSSWSDRSGNARAATQPVVADQPVVASANGRSVADFSNGNAYLYFHDVAIAAANQTVLAVYRANASSEQPQTVFASNRGFLKLAPTAQAVSYPGAATYQIDGVAVRGYENTRGQTTLSTFRLENALLQSVFGMSHDGETTASESLSPVLPTIGAQRLAVPGPAAAVQDTLNGQLYELILFPTALPEQKLRDVHDYLQSKWGGAISWDYSTTLRALELVNTRSGPHIIRGGWSDDRLGGGPGDDVISGGPGVDTLSGGPGADRFMFGGVDTGNDIILDFDVQSDIVDLSALFWGLSGDARDHISVRLDTDYSTPVPTLNSVLIVDRPDGTTQEIVLRNVALGAADLVALIVEGHIRMGSLSVPASVTLALASGSTAMHEGTSNALSLQLTRTGDGVAGAMAVPVGFVADALGSQWVLSGVDSKEGRRAVVVFGAGETQKTLTFRPAPDLETQGEQAWQIAVLPHYRYSTDTNAIEGTVNDLPGVTLQVLEANALVDSAQAARVRIQRAGSVAAALDVNLSVDGSITEGVHVDSIPRSVQIPAGQTSVDVSVTPLTGWDASQPRQFVLALAPSTDYQRGSPFEALLYVADSAQTIAGRMNFDHWLSTATAGDVSSFAALVRRDGRSAARDYVHAYAAGLAAPGGDPGRLQLRLVGGRPQLSAPINSAASDVRWRVNASTDLSQWEDATDEFDATTIEPAALELLGEPLQANDGNTFYRLSYIVDQNALVENGVASLIGGNRFGLEGPSTWRLDDESGDLISEAGGVPGVSRLIVEIDAPGTIDFEMELQDGSGSLGFYIDGIHHTTCSGASIRVQHVLLGAGRHVLMWEASMNTGNAIIRNVSL